MIKNFIIAILFSSIMYTYSIWHKNWKCTQAIIINNDPSNTQCITYMRKKEADQIENKN
jgi:hypothetical protein